METCHKKCLVCNGSAQEERLMLRYEIKIDENAFERETNEQAIDIIRAYICWDCIKRILKESKRSPLLMAITAKSKEKKLCKYAGLAIRLHQKVTIDSNSSWIRRCFDYAELSQFVPKEDHYSDAYGFTTDLGKTVYTELIASGAWKTLKSTVQNQTLCGDSLIDESVSSLLKWYALHPEGVPADDQRNDENPVRQIGNILFSYQGEDSMAQAFLLFEKAYLFYPSKRTPSPAINISFTWQGIGTWDGIHTVVYYQVKNGLLSY